MIGDIIAGVVGKVIDRVWPDPIEKAKAAMELEKMKQAGEFKELDTELQLVLAQIKVNEVEASSTDRFVSGWRPFIGWVVGAAFAWHYIGAPFAIWVTSLSGVNTSIPEIQLGDLFTLMLGMLGLGGMRSWEKWKGVVTK